MNVLVFYLISLLLLCGVEPGDSFFLQQAARFGPTVVSFSSSSVPPPPSSPCTYQINDRLNINSWKTARVTGSTTTSSSSSRLYGRNEEDEDRSIRKLVDDTDIENEGNLIIRQWKSLSPENKEDISTTSISFIIALFIRCFIIEPRFIPSLSMFPTFDVGDQLLVDKVSRNHNYLRRDVIVFNPSQTYTELTGNKEALIKRIVAIAGDSIEVRSSKVYVNGIEQDEPYVYEKPEYDLPLMKVPPGYLLVLGDNRNHSFDSHIWGFLPSENVIGRAVVKYWPPWRVGLVE